MSGTSADRNRTVDGWVAVQPWTPDRRVQAVRHQLANLLAPVTVAAELIDESPQQLQLQRAADRLRRLLARTRLLTSPGALTTTRVGVAQLAAQLGCTANGPLEGQVDADIARLQQLVIGELYANDPDLELAATTAVQLPAAADRDAHTGSLGRTVPGWLTITCTATVEPLTENELRDLAVPLASPRLGVGLALVAAEIHRHGGQMAGRAGQPVLRLQLPLAG